MIPKTRLTYLERLGTYSVEIYQLLDVFLRRVGAINLDFVFDNELSEVCRKLALLASGLVNLVIGIIV